MQVTQLQVANLCRAHAKDLALPDSGELAALDGAQVLWAFAGQESAFGQLANPRHEDAYCFSGKYFNRSVTAAWGCLAHCSYGPWQVMFPNFTPGVTPSQLLDSVTGPPLSIIAAVARLNQELRAGAQSLEQLADAYNSGNFKDSNVPRDYIAAVLDKYKIAMPQGV